MIKDGTLKEDNALDLSQSFTELCEACRRGDMKTCQEKIIEGVDINARDSFDCTPLILASLCGHYEVVRLLLDSGALCERDTFQGERCLYNALNDRIRNLLLQYDYSKSTDPLQPFAAHLASLLSQDRPSTSDIVVTALDKQFQLHKFVLSARSPSFAKRLLFAPAAKSWKLPPTIPPEAFDIGVRYLYLDEAPSELRSGPGTGFTEAEILGSVERVAKYLELTGLVESILDRGDRRLVRQRRAEATSKGRDQMESWFRENVLKCKLVIETDKVNKLKVKRDNRIFADILLRADEPVVDELRQTENMQKLDDHDSATDDQIPVGPTPRLSSPAPSLPPQKPRKSSIFPAHKAMLLRSDFFSVMFSSAFREAQITENLQIIRIDCSPEALEVVLIYLYTDRVEFPLPLAVEVLYAADMLCIERLKSKAAVLISSLGNGNMKPKQAQNEHEKATKQADAAQKGNQQDVDDEDRLEEFAARYLAYRLESHIDLPEFAELVAESAARIKERQETDSIELVDDIRFYLSERFRLRFEDSGLDQIMDETRKVAKGDGGEDGNLVEANAPSNNDGETDTPHPGPGASKIREGEAINVSDHKLPPGTGLASDDLSHPFRTLDGHVAGDEFARDAADYQILLDKLDRLLEKLGLEA
ncbi:ankyrin repeat and BTB/POZ domain-containing protein [Histoplasma capsulatum G186AR]|uniref:Ankyrin repeat and BTB/POZ domain-containing protein n=1 Tax=Ajellomyces capsulatus (strain G186AR / H82 / ATCC MYA-2454 / RMSCC 2432) TaxID=447093 RepID=C0NHU0_AJECG|nr:ankyrin repeat and BTB/POZ domain-containing protein [Histoplasma capsulatum G186AR]EEH09375.1 ankyrin repeat and BTB/POZ domain-containing protein [Histoplasma capsulatum G186AR]